jgi:FlaA1/EpsC-like NDP-sugar epimerase
MYHRRTQFAIDAALSGASLFVAYKLRFNFHVPAVYVRTMWIWVAALAVVRPASLLWRTQYRTIWKFLNFQDALDLALTSLLVSVSILAGKLAGHFTFLPTEVILLDSCVFVALAVSTRTLRRAIYEGSRISPLQRKKALLVGTEESLPPAIALVSAYPDVELVGLIAPGRHLGGLRISGISIIGQPSALAAIMGDSRIDVVLIADATLECIPDTVSVAAGFGASVRLLPSAANVVRDEVRVAAPVKAEAPFAKRRLSSGVSSAVLDCYWGRSVLITGAGGSIGSELSRQVIALGISRLILLDKDENSVFEIDRELSSISTCPELLPVVGDTRDPFLLESVFAQHRPDIVLHCAAYKHVPLMQMNVSEAVLNNVIGTRELADAATSHDVERFVMISSDKAVRPTSVMGATKRIAEMLLESRARSSRTRFASVRFGNVAGSRGSVIPIFLRQIAEGSPVTVTDERMTRYFMTISEAVQLVIQASTLALDGEIYILEMGKPVAVKTLASNLIMMSGQRPGHDIPLKIVGIRPGEKLHEQVCHEDDNLVPTDFERVYRVEQDNPCADIDRQLSRLERAARQRHDDNVLEQLRAMPIDFRESGIE